MMKSLPLMRSCIVLQVLLSIFYPLLTNAQTSDLSETSLGFSGYIMELPVYEHLQSTLALLSNSESSEAANLVRGRLRPTLYIGDNTKIGMEYEIDGLYFSQNSAAFGLNLT
ncbi:MAG: hypothetical protein KGJ59_06015, partial [Bacteroidota bacterium]|nr:hypothetical protein [Bacteroidota bacterium]